MVREQSPKALLSVVRQAESQRCEGRVQTEKERSKTRYTVTTVVIKDEVRADSELHELASS